MSLVYFITTLPPLQPGMEPPMTGAQFVAAARENLDGRMLQDLALLFLLHEVAQTTRTLNQAELGLIPENTDVAGQQHDRWVEADRANRLLPRWVVAGLPHEVLMRRWFQSMYRYARSPFLQQYARMSLNLGETVAGLLCKQEGLSFEAFRNHMKGGFDSTWRVILQHYDAPDLGLSKRLAFFGEVAELLTLDDFPEMERRLNRVRWKLIDSCAGPDIFCVDTVLAWFLKLRILEREASWNRKEGEAVLDQLLNFSIEGVS